MTNKEIAAAFQFLGNIMELHGENPFKIRSYQNAYLTLRKLDRPLAALSDEEISSIKGVGTAIAGKIRELLDTGKMATLEKYKAMTPEGIQEMLHIKGFGPKKVRTIWKELGAETIGELLYAVNENRLIELKGFGLKTQEELKKTLEYYQRSRNKFHYATLEPAALQLEESLKKVFPELPVSLTGAIRRGCNVVEQIELLIGVEKMPAEPTWDKLITITATGDNYWQGFTTEEHFPVTLFFCPRVEFGSKLFRYTASDEFLEAFIRHFPGIDFRGLSAETTVFQKAGIPFIAPELREQGWALQLAKDNALPHLIEEKNIRGVLHAHSTYSDGLHTLREMAEYTRDMGYEYLGITDHSKSAFYANGLQPGRVTMQMEEIDTLNREMAPFRIFKGIESDILSDGSLDYEDELLQQFDFIIASVHSNLRMDMDKATHRLVRAIENPFTSILGHPTGRLLLSRQGYPIDHKVVIDACAANGVAIELNANPYRLDLDWSWIPYALEKGVFIAINPDAHSREGIRDIHFGVLSARKGGLSPDRCLNTFSAEAFAAFCKR